MGGRCPECGTPIPVRSKRTLADNLAQAPTRYLRWIALGTALTLIGGVGGMAAMVVIPLSSRMSAVTMVFFALWLAGVWIVTRPHESSLDTTTDFKREGRWSRWGARLTQWGWLPGIALKWASAEVELSALAIGAPPDESLVRGLAIGGWMCFAIGLLGMVWVCVQFASLARWAGNEWAGEWMRGASLGMVAAPPMIAVALLGGSAAFVSVIIGVFGGVILVACAGVLVIGLVQLAGMSIWALQASAETMARDQRLADKREEDAKEFARRADLMTGANPLGVSGRPGKPAPKEADLSPIALEPDRPGANRVIRHERPGGL